MLYTTSSFCQSISNENHHVIVLIDRSACMQPEKKWEIKDVFYKLDSICFKEIDSTIGRQLLLPDHDYLSVLSFGLKELNDPRLVSYISTISCNKDFGYSLKKVTRDSHEIKMLYSDIKSCGIRRHKSGFFNLKYAFPTTAIPLALNHISNESKSHQIHRTFVIRVSDKQRNDDGVGSELKDYKNKIDINEIEEIANNFSNNFSKQRSQHLSKSFKREPSPLACKGLYYYIDVYELKPAIKGVSIESILKFPSNLELKRQVNKYVSHIKFDVKDNPTFTPLYLYLKYELNGIQIKLDTIDFTNKSNIDSISNIEIYNYNYTDSLTLSTSLVAQYNNTFYEGIVISDKNYTGLQTKIGGEFEKISKILGLMPMKGNWVFWFGEDQQQAKVRLEWAAIVLIIATVMFILYSRIKYLTKKPYPVSIKQFQP